jgi:hypothetical protein
MGLPPNTVALFKILSCIFSKIGNKRFNIKLYQIVNRFSISDLRFFYQLFEHGCIKQIHNQVLLP